MSQDWWYRTYTLQHDTRHTTIRSHSKTHIHIHNTHTQQPNPPQHALHNSRRPTFLTHINTIPSHRLTHPSARSSAFPSVPNIRTPTLISQIQYPKFKIQYSKPKIQYPISKNECPKSQTHAVDPASSLSPMVSPRIRRCHRCGLACPPAATLPCAGPGTRARPVAPRRRCRQGPCRSGAGRGTGVRRRGGKAEGRAGGRGGVGGGACPWTMAKPGVGIREACGGVGGG